MGLFSSKKKTYVGTSVTRVLEDDAITDTMKVSVIQAILKDEDISARVLENMQSTIGVRAERMYSWAKENYIYGLPSGRMVSTQEGVTQAQGILEAMEGQPVVIEYSHLAPANRLHVAWMRLISQYGYNPQTNELTVLSAQKGKTVLLDDIRIEVPETEIGSLPDECLEQWGLAAVSGYQPDRATYDANSRDIYLASSVRKTGSTGPSQQQARVIYSWESKYTGNRFETNYLYGNTTRASDQLIISLADLDQDEDFLHVKYATSSQTKYWMYQIGTGAYPILDDLYNVPHDISGTFFPFIFFRHNKTKLNEAGFGEGYRDNKKMCDILKLDYDTILDGIHENPDIKDVTQAVLTFAVPPNPSTQIEKKYLFDFFSEQWGYQDVSVRERSSHELLTSLTFFKKNKTKLTTKHAIVIQDRLFKMSLGFNQIYKRTKVGVIGSKGTYTSEYGSVIDTRKVEDDSGEIFDQAYLVRVYTYRYQISEKYYQEVEVRGLGTEYQIEGKYTTLGDEQDDILLVPIDRSITSNYPMGQREELYSRALHFVFNSMVVVKVKWYQSGFFKFVLTVASFAIAIYTFGASAIGQSLLAYSIGMTTLEAVVMTAITGLFTALASYYAIQLFIKAVGPELAFLVAAIAAVAGLYMMFDAGSIAGAPWAQDLLKLSNGLTSQMGSSIQAELADLTQVQSEFTKEMEAQMKLLDNAQDLLEPSKLLHPFTIFGESPNDFYNRTVHSGNIGTMSISSVTNYVDLSLTLPKFSETVGDTFV